MTDILLITAALLSWLVYSWPCNFAAHTLFSVRTHQLKEKRACCQNLLTVWLSRTTLLISLFILAVFFNGSPRNIIPGTWSMDWLESLQGLDFNRPVFAQ